MRIVLQQDLDLRVAGQAHHRRHIHASGNETGREGLAEIVWPDIFEASLSDINNGGNSTKGNNYVTSFEFRFSG